MDRLDAEESADAVYTLVLPSCYYLTVLALRLATFWMEMAMHNGLGSELIPQWAVLEINYQPNSILALTLISEKTKQNKKKPKRILHGQKKNKKLHKGEKNGLKHF